MAVFEQKKATKVTLDDTVPLTCTIEHAHNVKDHTEYVLRVQRGPVPDNNWSVTKRYSDFVALDAAFKSTGLNLTLPPKRVFGKMDREFVSERQQGLQSYLDQALAQPVLAASLPMKQFLDPTNYSMNLKEIALQQISMFFRAESLWQVIEPLSDIGWRIRKKVFLIKNNQHPKDKYVLSWNSLGPDKFLEDKDLEFTMKLLTTFQHPHIYPVVFSTANDTSGITIQRYCEQGTLRDMLYKVVKPQAPYFKKYGSQRASLCCQVPEIRLFGRQILDTLKFLHDKGFAHGHLHAGNIIVDGASSRVLLLETENWLLGLPSFYRQYITQCRKIQTLEAVDVYSFGQLLYEMALGQPLNAPYYETLPPHLNSDLRSVMDMILTTEACKNGMPSLATLKQHRFFNELVVPETEKAVVKIPSKIKEALKNAKAMMETRLQQEQKVIHQFKRLSKAQAVLLSEEEKKKRRKSKRKQLEENANNVAATCQSTDEATPTPSVQAPPTSTPAPPAPPPPVATPPPPPTANGGATRPSSDSSDVQALLGSINNFSKGSLKKATTVDKSAPRF